MQNPELCAEIGGQIVENAGTLSGEQCTEEAAHSAAEAIRTLGTAAILTGIVKGAGEGIANAARAFPRAKAFDKAGIETSVHFRKNLAQRGPRGVTEDKALDAYRNGQLYHDPDTGNYIRHSSPTGVSVVTDAPSGGRAHSVFEGDPSSRWVPVLWRPGQ